MSDNTFDPIEPILGEFQIVDAVAASGHRSRGTVRFEPYGFFAHSHAVLERGETRYGLAAVFRGRLVIAMGPKDKVEIGAYHRSGNRLEGIWVPPGAKGCDLAVCGREVSRLDFDTTFTIDQAHAVDQMPYTGRVSLDYLDPESVPVRRVKFNWSLHDGEYSSFGLAAGEILVSSFNFEPETPFAIGLYEPHNGQWRGTIAHSDHPDLSHETLKR
jgi:hypothetical protein